MIGKEEKEEAAEQKKQTTTTTTLRVSPNLIGWSKSTLACGLLSQPITFEMHSPTISFVHEK